MKNEQFLLACVYNKVMKRAEMERKVKKSGKMFCHVIK